MEHMKRMFVIAMAVIIAGAGLMYAHRHMYKNCGQDVQVQSHNSYDFDNSSESIPEQIRNHKNCAGGVCEQ